MRTIISALLLSTLLITMGLSQSQTNLSNSIAQTVESYIDQAGFSGTILVAHKGQPIFHRSYGLAYRATPETITNSHHYSIASVTKLFTSIRILQLVEDGRIDLTRPVSSYLQKVSGLVSEEVTIHHLLLHLSGLPEDSDDIYKNSASPESIVLDILKQQPASDPGSFNYNNADYMLLGLIIESVTKNSWEDELKGSILDPLGMSDSGFLEYGSYPQNFAYSYSKKWYGLKQDPLFYIENFYAAGRMYSTANDLLKLDQALYSDTLLSSESLARLNRSYPEYNYAGYGVWNYNYPFVDGAPSIMERRGRILGANVVLVRLLDENHTVIILSNDDRFNPDSFGDPTNLREMLIRTLYQSGS